MIDRTDILTTLQRLDAEYNNFSTDPELPILFSKLAVIEFCGWMEDCFDIMLFEYLDARISDADLKRRVKQFVSVNYGLTLDKVHKMCSLVLGADNWENVLDAISPTNFVQLQNVLGNYKDPRNSAAHTNIHARTAQTITYQTPSQVLLDFRNVLPAIVDLETQITALH